MYLRILAVCVVPVLAAACAAENDGSQHATATSAQELAAVIREQGNEAVRAMLADGEVSRAELETAALDVVSCAKTQGVEIQLTPTPDGYSATFAAPSASENLRYNEIYDQCAAETYDGVAQVWAAQTRVDPDREVRIKTFVVDCLANAGFDVPEWPDVGGIRLDPVVETECFDEALRAVPK